MNRIVRACILSLSFVLVFMCTTGLAEGAAGRFVQPVDKSHVLIRGMPIQAKDVSRDEPDEYLNINKRDLTLQKGKSEILKATLMPGRKSVSVKWYSSNPKIATVSNTGKVTAVASGKAVIYIEAKKYWGWHDKAGSTSECYVTVQGEAKDAKPLGASDRTFFYGTTGFIVPTSKLKDSLNKLKNSIGGYSYIKDTSETEGGLLESIIGSGLVYEGLLFGSKDLDKAHTYIYVRYFRDDLDRIYDYGFLARNNKSPIKTNRGIMIGSKKSDVQQKYGLPTAKWNSGYDGKTYESYEALAYNSKVTGQYIITSLIFYFRDSGNTVSMIGFNIFPGYY